MVKYLVMYSVEMYGVEQTACEGCFDTEEMAQAYIDIMNKEYDSGAYIEEVRHNPSYIKTV